MIKLCRDANSGPTECLLRSAFYDKNHLPAKLSTLDASTDGSPIIEVATALAMLPSAISRASADASCFKLTIYNIR